MIFHLLLGALAMWTVLFLVDFTRQAGFDLSWWQWTATVLNVIYFVFVIEIIYGFVTEGMPQAGLIVGLLTAFLGVIWAVLLGRFFFVKPKEHPEIVDQPNPATN